MNTNKNIIGKTNKSSIDKKNGRLVEDVIY
jgi:hypothetical protein